MKGGSPTTPEGRQSIIDRLENFYGFACEGGPLKNCVEWQLLKALLLVEAPPLHAAAPAGSKCSDCTIDGEACPTCYEAWWRARHPHHASH